MIPDDELTTVEFHKPTFLPCVPDRTSRTGYSFGAFAADGMAIEAFKHGWCTFRKPEPGALHLNSMAIYGGMLMNLKSDEFCSVFLRCCGGGECRQSIAR